MSDTAIPDDASIERHSHRDFGRDAIVFQGKLLLDGLRDVILFPVSLAAAAIDLIKRDDSPGRRFYDVLHLGKQTEQWIGLFDAVNGAPEPDRPRREFDGPSLDELVVLLERKLGAERERGGISERAKRAAERIRDIARDALRNGR